MENDELLNKTKENIDNCINNDGYKWMAIDKCGSVCLYKGKPIISITQVWDGISKKEFNSPYFTVVNITTQDILYI